MRKKKQLTKLIFDRNKYGRELLIDSAKVIDFKGIENQIISNFYLLGCLRKSSGKIQINTNEVELENHTIIFIPPNQPFDRNDSIFEEGYFIFFEGEFLDRFFEDSFFTFKFNIFHNVEKRSKIKLLPNDFDKIYGIFNDIHIEIQNLRCDSEHYLRSLLFHLLVKLTRSYSDKHSCDSTSQKNPIFLKFLQLLENNIHDKHTVAEYAYELDISRTYLNKLSKLYLNMTSKTVIQNRLLSESKNQIIYSQKDISTIASELNFSNSSNFNRFFKKLTGYSPLDYRMKYSK